MKRRFEQMPHEIQARMKIPAGFVVVKGSRPPLPDDLVWSVYSYSALNPSKSAVEYWLIINKTMLSHSKVIQNLWQIEKESASESIFVAKEEGLRFLSNEREKIMRMSHAEAIQALISVTKIDNKINIIKSISDNGLFSIT